MLEDLTWESKFLDKLVELETLGLIAMWQQLDPFR